MTKNKNLKKIFKEYQNYAETNGFHLNPDKKITEQLIKSLIERGGNMARDIALAAA